MNQALPLTVIICTWRRPESLRQLLLNLDRQDPAAAEILIVEGHPTERGDCARADCPICTLPVRNRGRHYFTRPSLEHQRNVGADLASSGVACFLDDDVLLEPGCLQRLSDVFQQDTEGKIGGVGGFMTNTLLADRVPWRWRIRRALGVVSTLAPGRYTRSGHSIPLEMAAPFTGCRPVDFLVGYCMAYRRHVLQEIRFVTDMYLGEDLHYSLRVGRQYQLYHCGDARLQHLHDPAGRANHRRYAFMSVYNHFRIHRDCLPDRNWRDLCLLWYGVALDLVMISVNVFFGRDRRVALDSIVGRLSAIGAIAFRGADEFTLDEVQRVPIGHAASRESSTAEAER